jgi:hypothetical protein
MLNVTYAEKYSVLPEDIHASEIHTSECYWQKQATQLHNRNLMREVGIMNSCHGIIGDDIIG